MTTIENKINLEQTTAEIYKAKIREEVERILPELLAQERKEFESEETRQWYINKWVDQAYKQAMQQSTARLKYKGGSENYK